MRGCARAAMRARHLLFVASCVAQYAPTDWRHWPPGVRTSALAVHIASVTNCLDAPNTSSPCGPLEHGRLSTSADWCSREQAYTSGETPLGHVLRNTTIDVIIIPAADDVQWQEGPNGGTIAGFVGDVIEAIAHTGGFYVNAYIIRMPDGSPSDSYGGSYTNLLRDWAPRGDLVANWWTDVPARRSLGVEYLASFYTLDLSLVAWLQPPPADEVRARAEWWLNFDFLAPFQPDLWLTIGLSALVIGAVERYINGKLHHRKLRDADALVEQIAARRAEDAQNMSSLGTLSLSVAWIPDKATYPEGSGALRVTLLHATGLLAQDRGGTSDPYAIVKLGSQSRKSTVRPKTCDPVWDEAFAFACPSLAACVTSSLAVHLYDFDPSPMSKLSEGLAINTISSTTRCFSAAATDGGGSAATAADDEGAPSPRPPPPPLKAGGSEGYGSSNTSPKGHKGRDSADGGAMEQPSSPWPESVHASVGSGDDPLGYVDVDLSPLHEAGGQLELEAEVRVPPVDHDKIAGVVRPVVRKYRWVQRLSEMLHGGFIAALHFLGGPAYKVEPSTLSAKVINGVWVFAVKILSASYTAKLAAHILAVEAPLVGNLSVTSMEHLRVGRRPVCVRAGGAPAALARDWLPEGFPVVSVSSASIPDSQYDMANRMRTGACAGTLVTFWELPRMLVGTANTPCDLRAVPPASVAEVPARGSWVSAGPLMRRRSQLAAHPNAIINRSSTDCTATPTAALGFLLRAFEGSPAFRAAREAMISRSRASTCASSGEPTQFTISGSTYDGGNFSGEATDSSANLDLDIDGRPKFTVRTLGGLWMILLCAAVLAIVVARPSRDAVRQLLNALRRWLRACRGLPPRKIRTSITRFGVLQELFAPAVQPANQQLGALEAKMGAIKELVEDLVERQATKQVAAERVTNSPPREIKATV